MSWKFYYSVVEFGLHRVPHFLTMLTNGYIRSTAFNLKKGTLHKIHTEKSKHRIWPSSVHPFKLDRGFIEIKTKNMMMLKEQVQTCKASSQLFDYLLLSDVNIFESIIVVSTTVLGLSYYTCLMVLYSSCTIMWAIGQYWHIVIYTSVILIFLI